MRLTGQELKAIINFIDQFTTVSLCGDEVGHSVVEKALEVNTHHHTKTCNKLSKEDDCRFHYPKFPVWKTVLGQPMEATEMPEEKERNLQTYTNALKKIKELLKKPLILNSIMARYNKGDETKEEYEENREERIKALLKIAQVKPHIYIAALSNTLSGYTVHQKRDLDELFINSYNPEWLYAWDANLDLQPCLDPYA